MKIKSITIKGFRGFNEERQIDFHHELTLIYAPNSYGKTSISEALEWLLYGLTSKVERADSKEEYKGSYRNQHLHESETPLVKANFIDGDTDIEFKGEMIEGESIKRLVNSRDVDTWPLNCDISTIPRPFILQHALKYLLLAKPDERFQQFSHLLGLEELDHIQKNIVSLCTKPDAAIPNEVRDILKNVDSIRARLDSRPALKEISKIFRKDEFNLIEIYSIILTKCRERVPPGTDNSSLLPQLLKIREDAINKIFSGRLTLEDYSELEKQSNSGDEKLFSEFLDESFMKKYTDLIALATVQLVLDRAEFLSLGINLLEKKPGICPFCGNPIDDPIQQHIRQEHKNLCEDNKRNEILQAERDEMAKLIESFRQRIEGYEKRNISKVTTFLDAASSLDQLGKILLPKHEIHFQSVKRAFAEIEPANKILEERFEEAKKIIGKVKESLKENKEDAKLLQLLGVNIVDYMAETHRFCKMVSSNVPDISNADQILKYELDILAGTEDISILIDLLDQRDSIEKSSKIKKILDGLKDLRRKVDGYVSDRVLKAISGELTADVMEWYGLIKTKGDPDVHFDGFDMERTKSGELKARRIKIRAKSYDKELVSAVSSLSESKLNALGLCVSVSVNLKGESPFDFLIIDDPIQSWDADHEVQFINVIRKLVEYGKQIILLSHNLNWLNQVCKGCRSINGWFYEITGYTKEGPHILEIPWENWKQRLEEVDAILKDPQATTIRLQQAEEEIRLVVCQIACELYFKNKAVHKSPHSTNSNKVRKMLTECSVDSKMIDRITQTFETTDDSHHAPGDYAPHKERIRSYCSWAYELANLLK